jgi:hypothetical protein
MLFIFNKYKVSYNMHIIYDQRPKHYSTGCLEDVLYSGYICHKIFLMGDLPHPNIFRVSLLLNNTLSDLNIAFASSNFFCS